MSVETLGEVINSDDSPQSFNVLFTVAANQAPPMPKTTPLLEALKAEKSANKDKEAILRNHAHYKDPAILASTNALRGATAGAASFAKDEVGKKKGGPSAQPRETASADVGKKGKKVQVTQAAVAKQQQAAAAAAAKKEHAPSPKLSRAARQQAAAARVAAAGQATAQSQAQTSDNRPAEAPPVASSSSGESGGVAAATSVPPASVAANVGAAVAASRRGRPIVGLASRHLQAALSQVGAAAIERKRREREKEAAAKEGTSANAAEGSAESGQGRELGTDVATPTTPEPPADREVKPGSPSSPRRDRRRKGHHEGGLKIPSIMQRPDGVPPPALQRDAPGQVLPSPARPQVTSSDSVVHNGPPGGHPPRGPRRGRGRGRGVPIHRGG